jgi:protein SCO1/2
MLRFLRASSKRLLAQGRFLLSAAAFVLALITSAQAGEVSAKAPTSTHHPGHGETAEPATVHVHPQDPTTASTEVGLDEKLGASIPLDLAFRDETGRAVTLRELITVPTVIAPVYYQCPNVCSFLQGGLARALPEVKLEPGQAFRVLSVSFDETETPELARRSQAIYLDAMRQRFPAAAWSFLTGEQESIRQLLDAAGYRFQRQGEDFLHPVVLFVVTGDGKIVRYLHGTSVLPMDLTLALVEASEGRIGPTIRRMAQFCFSYDAENRRYVFNLFRVSATVILLTTGAFLAFLIRGGRKNPDRPR